MRYTPFTAVTSTGDLIAPIPVEHINEIWPKVSGYLQSAIDRMGADAAYCTDDLRKSCLNRESILWAVIHDNEPIAAIITKVEIKVMLSVPWIGGKKGFLRSWVKPMLGVLEKYGKAFGCHVMTGHDRSGWCRVAGFSPIAKIEPDMFVRVI